MWSSRDIAIIIITAVVNLVLSVFIFQMASLIIGVQGFNFIFTFGFATIISLTFLLFEGRRWRFFFHNALAMLLLLPTSFGGTPFNVFPRLVIILAGIPGDVVLNTLYPIFKEKNRMVWWSILTTLFFIPLVNLFQILLFPLYFPPEFVTTYLNVLLIMSPFIFVGAIIGGYLGYQVYKRIEHFT
jgi:hypothetical protein